MDTSLFIFRGTVVVAPTNVSFVARERIVLNTMKTARIKICQIGPEFKTWFRGKVDPPFIGSTLCYAQLANLFTPDRETVDAVGGEEQAETTLAEMVSLMESQRFDDEHGPLLVNGWGNIFFVRDINRVLRSVCLIAYGNEGWRLDAEGVSNPFPKTREFRVFYRDPRMKRR